MVKFIKASFLVLSMLLTSCVMPSASPEIGSFMTDTPADHSVQNPTLLVGSINSSPVPIPSETPFILRPTPFVLIEYDLQPGTPTAIPNFAHPESGCNWMGVGGQVFDSEAKPKVKLLVRLTGTLGGKDINYVALTGGAVNLGSGGYEFKLADQPVDTKGIFQITIIDDKGEPMSQSFSFDTFNDCNRNFILINFVQGIHIHNGFQLFLPTILADGG